MKATALLLGSLMGAVSVLGCVLEDGTPESDDANEDLESSLNSTTSGPTVDELGNEMLRLANLDRTSLGKSALSSDRFLRQHGSQTPFVCPYNDKIINGRSRDMIDRDYFSHDIPGCTRSDGYPYHAWDHMFSVGYTGWDGENIAYNSGYSTNPATYKYGCDVNGNNCKGSTSTYESVGRAQMKFMMSPSHRANLLNATFHRGHCGVWTTEGDYAMRMYTCLFAEKGPSAPVLSTHHSLARWKGADRYSTAVAISKANFPPGVAGVLIATGKNYPDALAGGPAARKISSPLLLVDGTASAPPQVVKDELTRLKPANIYILGGSASVSAAMATSLDAYTTGSVHRLAGADRYATAVAVSQKFFAPGVPVVYMATGRDYPDALSAGGPAGARGGPVLLADGLSTSLATSVKNELSRLKPAEIVVVGGTGVFNGTLLNALKSYSAKVSRVDGGNRYNTSAKATKAFSAGQSLLLVSTGDNYPDALAGAALGKPLLLLPKSGSTSALRWEAERLAPSTVRALGGASSVTANAINNL